MVDHAGRPRGKNGLYYTCVNSPYYREYLPAIVREIAERYPVDGFLGHNWQGNREICYCTNCEKRYARGSRDAAASPKKELGECRR